MLVVVHEVGWHWLQMDRWIKMQSSEEELCCSNDIVHQIRIIQMYIWLHNSQPVTNAVLERHREACQEHDIMFCVMIHGRDILFSIIHLPPFIFWFSLYIYCVNYVLCRHLPIHHMVNLSLFQLISSSSIDALLLK